MNILHTIYNFFFKKKITPEQIVPEQDIEPVLEFKENSVIVKSPIRKTMKWVEARWLIMGEKTDYKKEY